MYEPSVSYNSTFEAWDTWATYVKVYKRKWTNYTSGEELFGLPITRYPELEKIEKDLEMLGRLYELYTSVISTINGYADILWVNVVTNIEAMTEQVAQFQAQCRKLPKSLRDWEAYRELRKTIDDILELLPLLQALSSPHMRPRHWKTMQDITVGTKGTTNRSVVLNASFASSPCPHAKERGCDCASVQTIIIRPTNSHLLAAPMQLKKVLTH